MAYTNTRVHLLDELDRIETILSVYNETDMTQYAAVDSAHRSSASSSDPATHSLSLPDPDCEYVAALASEIDTHCSQTAEDISLRLRLLGERFGCSRRHLDVLLIALAPEVNTQFGALFEEINEEYGLMYPTAGFIEELFSRTDEQQLASSGLIGPASPLRQHGFLEISPPPNDSSSGQYRLLSVDDRLISYLKGHDGIDPLLAEVASLEAPTTTLTDLHVDPQIAGRLANVADTDSMGHIHYFYGPEGAEKRRAVDALVDSSLLRADLDSVIQEGLLERLRREAILQDCPLHLTNATEATTSVGDPEAADSPQPDVDRPPLDEIADSLSDVKQDIFITGSEQWTPTANRSGRGHVLMSFPRPEFELRRERWESHTDSLPSDVDPEVLASTFEHTQQEIDDAIATARAISKVPDSTAVDNESNTESTLSREAIYEGCKAQSAEGLEELAERIEPSASWDEIILPEDTERQLREVAARVTHRGTVYEEWGFEDRFSRGTGVVALFAGPSGTGKTMAADIIASDAGMDLYKIDLSSVVSKYIGETEENLERIFDEARNSNAILLFDEADAVFGERGGVSDSTDRYANVEVNYLLQRIESYDGVVLLTTNFESHIDDAFLRRIHQSVSFKRPTDEARKQIWEVMFPDDTPTEGLDYEFLGRLELTGGNIRNAVQTAAILAADDGGIVQMKHVVEAVQREFSKLDKMVDPTSFGEYQELLRT